MEETKPQELAGTGYEIFIGLLSLLSIVNVVLVTFIRYDPAQDVVYAIDAVLSLVFLGDFLLRLRRAPSRSAYFWRGFGWADLLASLPFPQFKILRIFRLVRVVRLLRAYGIKHIATGLMRDRASSALLSLLFVAILVLEFGSLVMLRLESASTDANITTASDALWYILVTMSTVGYGDQFPVTTMGRNVGAFIIILGVAIFGTLTGFLANFFLAPRRVVRAAAAADAPPDARKRLEELEALVERQKATMSELRKLLDRE